jgi:hypothetical protein
MTREPRYRRRTYARLAGIINQDLNPDYQGFTKEV